jgi:threonine aldolase
MKRTFASDNYSGVHPDIFAALQRANQGHTPSYGADEYTARATALFRQHFTPDTEVFFAYNGTGANVIGLSAITRSFEAIICSDLAHINVDESTAPEKFLGCKLVTIPTEDGKIYPHDVEHRIQRVDDQHHPQARVISISQSTEYGTVYSVEEIQALAAVARKHDLYLHMDGSRLANAAVSLGKSFREFTVDAGVDVLSFGGTKNGLMFGEAVLFFHPALAKHFKYIRKQSMQLHSKMRFIGAQFEALLRGDLWKQSAGHANAMARLLEQELRSIPGVTITRPVQANGIFATLPPAIIPALQEEIYFYVWNEKTSEIRLMCSFDTQEEDVRHFSASVRRLIGAVTASRI